MIPSRQLQVGDAKVHVYPDGAALCRATAEAFVTCAREAIASRGRFNVALAGGSTPKAVYALLAEQYAAAIPWENVHLFFGDERHVPPDDANSNFRMVRDSLLANASLRPVLHRIEAELPAIEAAERYAVDLVRHFGVATTEPPRFDLILLGMGTDGHTASLFPGTAALSEQTRSVVANDVPQLNTTRITLTYPVINNAAKVLFLTAGTDKAAMLRKVLRGDLVGVQYPSQFVRPRRGELIWMTDAAAAAELGQENAD